LRRIIDVSGIITMPTFRSELMIGIVARIGHNVLLAGLAFITVNLLLQII
jgi:hypothetical protein